jgi:rhodanese-related sulfurtransferase
MVQLLTPAELAAMQASGAPLDLVDVRDPEEWVGGRIAGARLIPLAELRADPDAVLAHGVPIVFACAKGVRGMQAAKLAERFGYEPVYNLDGGTAGWAAAGLPLVTDRRGVVGG